MRKRFVFFTAVVALLIAACGGGDDGGATTTDAPDETTTTAAEEVTTTATAETDGIHTADTDLGSILVDAEGFTLYIFTNDTDGESTCYDACADLWPPVPGDATISSDLDASIFGTTTRDDGSEQLTVNGMPLYLYTPDSAPGDTAGQGFNGVWFVVDGDGAMIEAAADDSQLVDYGY